MQPDLPFWSIPRSWEGDAVAILGGGASLTQEQVDYCRDKCRVVAINKAYRLASWADWLWGCDPHGFWQWEPNALEFAGTKITLWSPDLRPERARHLPELAACGVKILRHMGSGMHTGLSDNPGWVRGNNGGYQAINAAALTGAKLIILLGMDMRAGHWHEPWPMPEPNYETALVPNFATMINPLSELGVQVVNATPNSALECFPMVGLDEIL